MKLPEDLKYTKDHEWVRIEGATAIVGITEFAQSELGDIVYVDLPAPGKIFREKDALCVVESTKAASDVYAPVAGVVAETNPALGAKPELINKAPYAEGWLVKLKEVKTGGVNELLSASDYKAFLESKA